MASEVEICNTALANLGDRATVASLNPPEGSAQAEHCAIYYPIARDGLLSVHDWGFATQRIKLAKLTETAPGWHYTYARPNGAIKILSVMGADEPEPGTLGAIDEAHPFVCELGRTGAQVIHCNLPDASTKYLARTTSTEKFSALFTLALTWQLASMLAGPVIKGEAGRNESKRCAQIAQVYLEQAKEHDATQQHLKIKKAPDWVKARGAAINTPWGR